MDQKENIPQNLDPIQVSTKINAQIEEVWDAITNPQKMREWYFDIDTDAIADGTVFSFYEPGDKKQYLHECLVLEMKKPSKFRHTWAYPNISQGSSTVNWDLEKDGKLTEVILTHESIHDLADGGDMMARENFAAGWKEIIEVNLKKYLES